MSSKKYISFFCVLLLLPLFAAGSETQTLPIVVTKSGLVQGTEETSFESRQFFSFRGIPYAEPPLGPLRFKVSKSAILCHSNL